MRALLFPNFRYNKISQSKDHEKIIWLNLQGIYTVPRKMQKSFIAGFTGDILVVTASFVLCVGMKPGSGSTYYNGYTLSFLFFLLIWLLVSFSLEKYNFHIISSLANTG